MIYLSLDPGGTTGVCHAVYAHDTLMMQHFEVPLQPHMVPEWLDYYDPDILIYESFQYRRVPNADLTAVELIGVIKYWDSLPGDKIAEVISQPPGSKTLWDDEKLKRAGFYKPGAPHANDATRHLLYYISKLPPSSDLYKEVLGRLK